MYQETWEVVELEVKTNFLGYSQLVAAVQWRFTVDTNLGRSINVGWTALNFPRDNVYTDYQNLTQEQVLVWVRESMGAERLNSLRQQALGVIQASAVDPVEVVRVQGQFPWTV